GACPPPHDEAGRSNWRERWTIRPFEWIAPKNASPFRVARVPPCSRILGVPFPLSHPISRGKPMNRTLLSLLAVAVLVPAVAGCGPSREEQRREAAEEAARDMERRAEEGDLAGAMEAFGNAM